MNAVKEPIEPRRLVTISYFVVDMLGLKNRLWYYRHVDEPGMPQRVYIGEKPMLRYDECAAFVDRLVERRDAPPPSPAPKVRRHPGRPAKVVTPS